MVGLSLDVGVGRVEINPYTDNGKVLLSKVKAVSDVKESIFESCEFDWWFGQNCG